MNDGNELIQVIKKINSAWLEKDPERMESFIHPEIVMVFPGFSGSVAGRREFMGGFTDFCNNAVVHEFDDSDYSSDLIDSVGIVSFRFTMVYERDGQKYRSSGRDLWTFSRESGSWLAVWRTMIEPVDEKIG